MQKAFEEKEELINKNHVNANIEFQQNTYIKNIEDINDINLNEENS